MLIEKLNAEETRVLGTLIEKSLATPDYYPLTLNSLRLACNQKSNRDPVTDYTDATVTEALVGLKRKTLITFIPYGNQGQSKYRHFLEDPRFNLQKAEIAVLGVLLLRGQQTLNEIKMRASSLFPISSLEDAENILNKLSQRAEPLTQLLPKKSGWKEPRWCDTIGQHEEIAENPSLQKDPIKNSSASSFESHIFETQFLESSKAEFLRYKNLGLKSMEALTDQELNTDMNESNSIAIIVKHLHGNMQSRWTNLFTEDGEKPWRQRDQEFAEETLNKEKILSIYQAGWSFVENALQGIKPEDFSKPILIRQESLTLVQAIHRQISHYGYHIGQIVMLAKQFKGKDWASLSIPKGQSAEYLQGNFLSK